jgi:exodeoxyribonuclease VII large subunit
MNPNELELGVSEFVALLNQSMEYTFPNTVITGELANLRVSKNKWLYFDLKDENSTVKFFGTVYHLPGPLEDGMLLRVRGTPRLHNLYGFSVNVTSLQLAGEGTLKRAAQLLEAKLMGEGLFDESRKRPLPYPPKTIGLVSSKQSAAYADFVKVLSARWRGLELQLIDVQVQGEVAPGQIVEAIERFNAASVPPDVVVLIRGGGSPEDLAAFSTEQVTRAVAASRVPTLVAIGHEIDVSLAELAADKRASTPSNAAELLVPDRKAAAALLAGLREQLTMHVAQQLRDARQTLISDVDDLSRSIELQLTRARQQAEEKARLLTALSPTSIMRRGYAIVRSNGKAVESVGQLKAGAIVDIEMRDGRFGASVNDTKET